MDVTSALSEGRVHDCHVVALAAQIDETEPARGILGKQPPSERAPVRRPLGIIVQSPEYPLLSTLPAVLIGLLEKIPVLI